MRILDDSMIIVNSNKVSKQVKKGCSVDNELFPVDPDAQLVMPDACHSNLPDQSEDLYLPASTKWEPIPKDN
jgi:hypothetical protein